MWCDWYDAACVDVDVSCVWRGLECVLLASMLVSCCELARFLSLSYLNVACLMSRGWWLLWSQFWVTMEKIVQRYIACLANVRPSLPKPDKDKPVIEQKEESQAPFFLRVCDSDHLRWTVPTICDLLNSGIAAWRAPLCRVQWSRRCITSRYCLLVTVADEG